MVQLIYGKKGSGKTKRLIDMANQEVETAKGDVIFIDDDKRYMYDVKHEIRFVNVKEYDIDSEEKLFGFICGMCAANFDISAFYLDAFMHIIKKDVSELEVFVKSIEQLARNNDNLKLVINVSADPADAPEFLKQYII